MTTTEIAQLRNERDAWRAEAEAWRRKFAPLRGRSVLAITVSIRSRRLHVETTLIEDARDAVRVCNYLRDIEAFLAAHGNREDEGRKCG